jgi:hypothetical protein
MIVALIVDKPLTEEQMNDALEGKEITIIGKFDSIFSESNSLTKMYEKVKLFDHLIESGFIERELLDIIGYKQ